MKDDWIDMGAHRPMPRRVYTRDRFLTFVSKKIDLTSGIHVLDFSAADIPAQPEDGGFFIRAVTFFTLNIGSQVFCSRAKYGDKDLVAPQSWASLSFIEQHWEVLAIPPGAVLSMDLQVQGKPNCVVATFAVTRLRESR